MLFGLQERNVVGLVLGVLLFAGGFLAGKIHDSKRTDEVVGQAYSMKQLRDRTGTYTNPLLMCDIEDEYTNPLYAPLQQSVAALVNRLRGEGVAFASVYFRDLSRGTSFVVNPDVRYTPASLNKIPLMMKVFERAQEDPTFLTKQVVSHDLTDANTVQLIQPKASMKAFAHYSVEDAVKLMIFHSDNNAYNAITRQIPYSEYLSLFDELKIPVENSGGMTVGELSYFLRVLYNSTVLSKEMSEKALEYLTQTDYVNGLRAGVPEEVAVAHKFGTSGEIGQASSKDLQLHDCGIVYAPEKPYLLCVMTKGTGDIGKLEELVAGVSRIVYESISRMN